MKRWYYNSWPLHRAPECSGSRLCKESGSVKVSGETIIDINSWTIDQSYDFFANLALSGSDAEIASELLKEITNRLGFL